MGTGTALTSVTTDAGGTTAINGGAVTTTAGQSYGDNVTLGANATLASTGAGNITLGGTTNGGFTLAGNTGGATLFTGAVGAGTALTSLTTDAGGTTSVVNVTTAGAQSYGDNVTLNGTYTTTNSAFTASGYQNHLGQTPTGDLYRYERGGRHKIGWGWKGMAVTGAGDLTGDGVADVLAKDAAGVLWRYDGNGTGGLKTRVKAGWGWNGLSLF